MQNAILGHSEEDIVLGNVDVGRDEHLYRLSSPSTISFFMPQCLLLTY